MSCARYSELLGLRTRLVLASERAYPRGGTAQERVIRICLEEGGTRYVNPIRARSLGLYDQAAFAAAGLELSYLSTNADIRYDQNGGPFVPNLSIIDVLMFNSPAQTRELLDRFVLTPPQSLRAPSDIKPSPPRPRRVPLDRSRARLRRTRAGTARR